jgi:hypothetical protein
MSFSKLFFDNSTKCDGNLEFNNLALKIDHSSAFIDLDGDCQNDLLIHSSKSYYDPSSGTTLIKNFLEIWRGSLKNNQVKYCLSKFDVYEIDEKLGQFTVDDFDRDGLLDLIFPIYNSGDVLIAYNKLSLDYDWSADYCATHSNSNLTDISSIFDSLNLKESKVKCDSLLNFLFPI